MKFALSNGEIFANENNNMLIIIIISYLEYK